jgi:hypothetical protein
MNNFGFYSIQEMVEKTNAQRKQIEQQLDSEATFHPEQASILTDQKAEEHFMLKESLKQIPLKEFLIKSGTTGVAGAAYLVADAVHTNLIQYSQRSDIVPLISAEMVNGWKGGDLKVDILSKTGYVAMKATSGAQSYTKTVETKQATLTPIGFNVAPRITDDLLEDAAFDLIDYHVQKAAVAIGELATDMALAVLGTATDGWGTLNSGNASADETTWAQVLTAIEANTDDRWISNTVITTPESWEHSIHKGIGLEFVGGAAGDAWTATPYNQATTQPLAAGFDFKLLNLDILLHISDYLHAAVDTTGPGALTDCKTFIFDRNNALLTGRKRWMQLDNYSDPVKDLAGCVVSCRQNSVTLYNDAIYKLSET